MLRKLSLSVNKIVILCLIFLVSVAFGYGYFTNNQRGSSVQKQEKNTAKAKSDLAKAFLSESYDKIKENYWDNLSEGQLVNLFKLSAERSLNKPLPAKIQDKEQLIQQIDLGLKDVSGDKKGVVVQIISQVLSSLNPPGRSGLYTEKQEIALKNTVENVDPQKDLYKDLGLAKGASEEKVSQAFQKQAEELKKQATPEAQEKLKQITYAKDVLTQPDKKQRYDQKGVEPTIFTRVVSPGILYMQFKKFSPTSLEEFQKAFESYQSNTSLYGLIFDLRGNIGGAIDATAYFLGYFLGKGQYAFDFYHKGEYEPFKTPTDKLASILKYKQIIILVDNQTQSSAEMMAASLKKYRVGIVVGIPTRGWGTVERVFPLENQLDPKEKYSIFLVHSITLRDDNQPIEGRGVEPNVNIKEPGWEQQLFNYFRNNQLIEAVKTVILNP